jgi:hypothetical protein
MINAQYGKIKKIEEIMVVYRIHTGGTHSTLAQYDKTIRWINQLKIMSNQFSDNVNNTLKNEINTRLLNLIFSENIDFQKKDIIIQQNPALLKNIISEAIMLKKQVKELSSKTNSGKNAIGVLLKKVVSKTFNLKYFLFHSYSHDCNKSF